MNRGPELRMSANTKPGNETPPWKRKGNKWIKTKRLSRSINRKSGQYWSLQPVRCGMT